ncbi:SPOR domain-containing protein [Methylocapsa sp. D3K7]|uniref:SPOR domain-containing protein n=1 Tax=Methylocapsa sp. D3K7 TaxID=3041435 RepID=UPI00244E6976|nr:SPOR domain-containing protein [Methylocapsa sp. D3K7]WGJ14253.1 SPOR domain-containing protein [Methylocapsa sp. D3K7]
MSEQIVKRRPMIDLEEFERRLRQPLAAPQANDDPLAELARSFGGAEADPYKTVFEPLNRRPAAAWRNEDRADGKLQGGRPLIGGDFASIEAGLLGAGEHTDNLSEPEDAADYPQNGQENWPYAETDAETSHVPDSAYEEVRSRRPLYVMAAMIIAGIAGIGASFAFKGTATTQNEIATIRAAEGPAKVHPETVASTEVTDRDATVLGGAQTQPPIAAINNVEQPADLSAQHDLTPVIQGYPATGQASGAAGVPVPPPPPAQIQAQTQIQPQPAPEPTIAGLIEPKKVKTVSVRPDGTLLANSTPPQATVPVKPVGPAKAAPPKSAPRVASGDPAPAKPKRVQVADAQPQAPAAEAATHVAAGTFAVQLAAPGSEQEAREVQVRLMKKFSGELAGFHPSIHKAEVGGKPVYRVRVSGLATRDEATALCQKIQGGGGNCFVAKN